MSLRVYVSYFGKPWHQSSTFRDWELSSLLLERRVTFVPLRKAQQIWLMDFSVHGLFLASRFRRRNRVLICFEPRAVKPLQYRKLMNFVFGTIFVFSKSQMRRGVRYIEGGGYRPERALSGAVMRDVPLTHDVVIASGFKQGVVKTSQYHLRTDVIEELVRLGYRVGVAGHGWSSNFWYFCRAAAQAILLCFTAGHIPNLSFLRMPPIKRLKTLGTCSYFGYVEDEVRWFSQARVVVVIENCREFFSEKLFSALCSRRSVVYCGPSEAQTFKSSAVFFAERPQVSEIVKVAQLAIDSQMDIAATRRLDGLPSGIDRRNETMFYLRLADALLAKY